MTSGVHTGVDSLISISSIEPPLQSENTMSWHFRSNFGYRVEVNGALAAF